MGGLITINHAATAFEREPLSRPFGFKGGYVSELWQSVTLLKSGAAESIGLATQSVLWSDPAVFAAHPADGGNELMFDVSTFAAEAAVGRSFQTPLDLLDEIYPAVYEYARGVTGNSRLRKTFVLNALVGLDNAAWLLYAFENGFSRFEELIPELYRPALQHRHGRVASVPTISYGTAHDELWKCAEDGPLIVKVKLGHPGSQEEMLAGDVRLLGEVHGVFGPGGTLYYLDANGRYEEKETLVRLLDGIDSMGILDRVVVLEEPFPEAYEVDVADLGVRMAADESAHTEEDARRRIEMGYGAIALKPVAKTMSMTFKIAGAAHEAGVPCFCADLTVNPILVDWNKNVAARLAPLPGLDCGLLEANGRQNYRDWERMEGFHPCARAAWTRSVNSIFELEDDFYAASGGIFELSEHYVALVKSI